MLYHSQQNFIPVLWEACLSSPCDNGATGIDVNVDTFICMCKDGYFGVTCLESKYQCHNQRPCWKSYLDCYQYFVTQWMWLMQKFYNFVLKLSINYCWDLWAFVSGYSDTSFLATFNELYITPTDPIVFDNAVLNTGGHYDPTTGIYTVPIDDTYEFIVWWRWYWIFFGSWWR